MPDIDPDDRRAEALAESLRNACADYPNHIVLFELVGMLGECIGHYALHERPNLLDIADAELRHQVSDAYPGNDHAA